MIRTRAAAVVVVAASLAVPGIAAAVADDTAPSDSPPAAAASTSVAAGEPSDGAGPPIDIDFQIDMMLGLVPQDEMQGYWGEQEERRQLGIQECMNEAGFEYNPEDSGAMFFDPFADLTPVEYAEQYGFGIYTTMDPDNDPFSVSGQEWVWPNQEIVEDLDPAEQNAWFEVSNRCSMDAMRTDDPFMNPMVQQIMEDLFSRVQNDPRVRDANDAWVDCMEEAGHPYSDRQAMDDEWFGEAWGETGEGRAEEFYQSEAWKAESPDHAEWQSLVELEIEVAVASAQCSEGHEDIYREVQGEQREELVDAWQAVDWDLPPVTFLEDDFFFGPSDATLPEGALGSLDTSVEEDEADEPVVIDLGGADSSVPETTDT